MNAARKRYCPEAASAHGHGDERIHVRAGRGVQVVREDTRAREDVNLWRAIRRNESRGNGACDRADLQVVDEPHTGFSR